MQRTAAATDFSNRVSHVVEFNTQIFINPDLIVALSRVQRGEWAGFDVVSRLSEDGWGQAEAQIFDAGGLVCAVAARGGALGGPAITGS